jgi:hypothetical protein
MNVNSRFLFLVLSRYRVTTCGLFFQGQHGEKEASTPVFAARYRPFLGAQDGPEIANVIRASGSAVIFR